MAEHLVTVRFGIVCDQVRREDNGKLFMIGVYGRNITVASFPAQLMLSVVIGVWSNKPVTDHPLEVQTAFNGEKIHSGRGNVSINDTGADIIVLSNILVMATSPGKLEFRAKFGTDRWKIITTIPLEEKA